MKELKRLYKWGFYNAIVGIVFIGLSSISYITIKPILNKAEAQKTRVIKNLKHAENIPPKYRKIIDRNIEISSDFVKNIQRDLKTDIISNICFSVFLFGNSFIFFSIYSKLKK